MPLPEVELRITIDGVEVFALLKGNVAIGCGAADRDLVLSTLAEALSTLCGARPKPDFYSDVTLRRPTPAPVLSIVRPEEPSK